MATDDMLRKVEHKAEMWKLKGDLEKALPNSVCVYNLVLLCAQTDADTHAIYVPRDETSNIIIIKDITRENLSVHCPPEESALLRRIFLETSAIDFSRPVLVANLPEDLVPLVKEVLAARGGRNPKDYIDWMIYYFPRDLALSIPKMTYEDGEVLQLGEAGLRHLYDTWSFKDLAPFSVVEALWRHTPFLGFYLKEDLVRAKGTVTIHDATPSNTSSVGTLSCGGDPLPSGLSEDLKTTTTFPASNDAALADLGFPKAPPDLFPAAWVGFGRAGVAGQLMVDPAHSGRGLSSALVLALLPAMASQGYEIGFHVENSNWISKAYAGHGAQTLFRDHWIYLPSRSHL
ncbi:uncharacterized protein LOC143028617 [Oratosquilla oratoria]|uniref:uncharacterized protein LOC143028617 n=1 Tax=Oratosquilla oratoria TaxID=337810 RepID=UPI003F768422